MKNVVIPMLLIAAILNSCATIVQGSHQSISISSNPTNAYIWVDRNYVGNTPLIVDMSRKDTHIVRIELPGYQAYEICLARKVNGWIFGNIIFGGVVGIAVDAITGAFYKLTPEQVMVDLRANGMGCTQEGNQTYIAVVLEPNPQWEKIGNLLPE